MIIQSFNIVFSSYDETMTSFLSNIVTVSDTPITTGKIFFKINGKTLKDANGKVIYAKLDSNGEVSVDYNIGNLKVNTYTVKAVFNDPGYDKIESDTTMTVVKS